MVWDGPGHLPTKECANLHDLAPSEAKASHGMAGVVPSDRIGILMETEKVTLHRFELQSCGLLYL